MEGDGGTGPAIGIDPATDQDETMYTLTDKAGKVIAIFKSLAEAAQWLNDRGKILILN